MTDTLTKLAYQALQQSKHAFGLAHKTLSTRVLNAVMPFQRQEPNPLSAELLKRLQQRINDLLEVDWQDAEAGVYAKALLFDNPWEDFFRFYPWVLLDTPKVWQRANQKRHQEFAESVSTQGYPSYYVQNFHHQTDGYLSEQSANLYDLQVELLFNGTADPMRRRILAPLKRHLDQRAQPPTGLHALKILDVACGTGRTLKMLRQTFPEAALYGVDLSSAYLRKANQLLAETSGDLPQLMQANAEQLPYVDNYFEAVTSVFLFHELPAAVRQTVINECFRVTQPGGILVICDSIQQADSPEFKSVMENFPAMFHEPYYRHYTTDDLVGRLSDAGFGDVTTEVHFMSKYWIARKPA